MEVNNTTNCTRTMNSKPQEDVLVLYSVFSTISILFYLAAIFMIAQTRVYDCFIHRLTLYLAVGGILRSVAYMLQVLPVDLGTHPAAVRKGWEGACVLGGFMIQYSSFVQAFTVAWICLFVFGKVVYRNKTKLLKITGPKLEIAGVALVMLAPLIFTWEPFITNSYGLVGTRCWIVDHDCHSAHGLSFAYGMAINVVPNLVLALLGLTQILGAIFVLYRKVFGKDLERYLWIAIKEILPLAIFPTCYLLVTLGRMLAILTNKYTTDAAQAFMALLQLCSCTLPLSLLVQPYVRQRLCRGIRTKAEEKEHLMSLSSSAITSTHTM